MLAGLCALAVLLIATAWLYTSRVPPLTNDQVQQLVDEYWICEFLGDTPRAHELFRDLDREGIVMRLSDDGVKWERR